MSERERKKKRKKRGGWGERVFKRFRSHVIYKYNVSKEGPLLFKVVVRTLCCYRWLLCALLYRSKTKIPYIR